MFKTEIANHIIEKYEHLIRCYGREQADRRFLAKGTARHPIYRQMLKDAYKIRYNTGSPLDYGQQVLTL